MHRFEAICKDMARSSMQRHSARHLKRDLQLPWLHLNRKRHVCQDADAVSEPHAAQQTRRARDVGTCCFASVHDRPRERFEIASELVTPNVMSVPDNSRPHAAGQTTVSTSHTFALSSKSSKAASQTFVVWMSWVFGTAWSPTTLIPPSSPPLAYPELNAPFPWQRHHLRHDNISQSACAACEERDTKLATVLRVATSKSTSSFNIARACRHRAQANQFSTFQRPTQRKQLSTSRFSATALFSAMTSTMLSYLEPNRLHQSLLEPAHPTSDRKSHG